MIDCPFCKKTRPSVKAHAIPEAIFQSVRLDDGPLREMGPMGHSKLRPKGSWDYLIWCAECERTYSSSESAAINCWRALANTKSLPLNEPKLGTSADFHEFLLFMLWKAAESEQPFYENVNLGQMQNKLRDALIAADEQKRASFDVILSSPIDPPMCIVQPISFRIEGVRFVKFYLDHLDVLIKTDSRLLPESLRPLVMSRDAAWLYVHPIPRSPHLNQLLHATALNRQKALRAKKKRRTRENIP